MSETAISWTDRTWNVVTGCEKVSPGCGIARNAADKASGRTGGCYAQALHNSRYRSNVKAALAYRDEYRFDPASYMMPALRTLPETMRAAAPAFYRPPFPDTYDTPFAVVTTHADRLTQPLKVRKPQKWFTCSMGDLFHEDVPDEFLDRVFAVMALTPHHIYQVLTKRPERMRAYLSSSERSLRIGELLWVADGRPPVAHLPLPNVWLGTSVEDQQRADERIPELLATPAAVRFLSCEPLLGPVEFTRGWLTCHMDCCNDEYCEPPHAPEEWCDSFRSTEVCDRGVDWVIVGGESGPRFRAMDPEWARSLKAQADAAGVAVWMKQGSGRKSEQPFGHPELDGARAFPAGVGA